MTSVRATCDRCGDIRLPASEFVVRTLIGEEDGEYRFKCQCGFIVLRQCTAAIVALLIQAGVRHEVYEHPLELMERPTDSGTLSEDDVIDLHLAFEDGSAFDKITGRSEE